MLFLFIIIIIINLFSARSPAETSFSGDISPNSPYQIDSDPSMFVEYGSISHFTYGDFNGDGITDSAFLPSQGDNTFFILMFGPSSDWEFPLDEYINGNISRGIIFASEAFSVPRAEFIGDFNNDGLDDILIGIPSANPSSFTEAGRSILLYGTSDPLNTYFNGNTTVVPTFFLETMNSTHGILFNGASPLDQLGNFIGPAGDVNNDGYDDILIGASHANFHPAYSEPGIVYLVLGRNNTLSPWDFPKNISFINSTTGQKFYYPRSHSFNANLRLRGADINLDGYSDIFIGAGNVDIFTSSPEDISGALFIVFGTVSFSQDFSSLYFLNGNNGTIISNMQLANGGIGSKFQISPDLNGDGFPDLVLSSRKSSNPFCGLLCGTIFVLFGNNNTYPPTLNIGNSSLYTDSFGVRIDGNDNLSGFGARVATGGDVNNDGFPDIYIGEPGKTVNGEYKSGRVTLIFGPVDNWFPDSHNTTNSTIITLSELNQLSFVNYYGAYSNYQLSTFLGPTIFDINNDSYADVTVNGILPGLFLFGHPSCSPSTYLDSATHQCTACPIEIGYIYNPSPSSSSTCNKTTLACGPKTFFSTENGLVSCQDCPPDSETAIWNPDTTNALECTPTILQLCPAHYFIDTLPSGELFCSPCTDTSSDINPNPNSLFNCSCDSGFHKEDTECILDSDNLNQTGFSYVSLFALPLIPLSIVWYSNSRQKKVSSSRYTGSTGGGYFDTASFSSKCTPEPFHSVQPAWNFAAFSAILTTLLNHLKGTADTADADADDVKITPNSTKPTSPPPEILFDASFASLWLLFSSVDSRENLVKSKYFSLDQLSSIFSHFKQTPLLPGSHNHFSIDSLAIFGGLIFSTFSLLGVLFSLPIPFSSQAVFGRQVFWPFLFIFRFKILSFGLAAFLALLFIAATGALTRLKPGKEHHTSLDNPLVIQRLRECSITIGHIFYLPILYQLLSVWSCSINSSNSTWILSFSLFSRSELYSGGVECLSETHIVFLVISVLLFPPFLFLALSALPKIHTRYIQFDTKHFTIRLFLFFIVILTHIVFPATIVITSLTNTIINIVFITLFISVSLLIVSKQHLFPHSPFLHNVYIFSLWVSFWMVISSIIALIIDNSTSILSAIILVIISILVAFIGPSNLLSNYDSSTLIQLLSQGTRGTSTIRSVPPDSDGGSSPTSINMRQINSPSTLMVILTSLLLVCTVFAWPYQGIPESFAIPGGIPLEQKSSSIPMVTLSPPFDLGNPRVASAGDFNNDGYLDFILGFPTSSVIQTDSGEAWLFWGGPTFADIDIFSLNSALSYPTQSEIMDSSLVIYGEQISGGFGKYLGSLGDINNDSIDDMIICAPDLPVNIANPNENGRCYLFFGSVNWRNSDYILMDNETFDGSNGLYISGFSSISDITSAPLSDSPGYNDFNGDGFIDFAIGHSTTDLASGAITIIFGRSVWPSSINVTSMSASDGIIIIGSQSGILFGAKVEFLGDFNGNGFKGDLAVTSPTFNFPGNNAGRVSVLYSGVNTIGPNFNISDLNSTQGFHILGKALSSPKLGYSLSSIGDFNNDGLDDMLVGSRFYHSPEHIDAGAVFIIWGNSSGSIPLTNFIQQYTDDPSLGLLFLGYETNQRVGQEIIRVGDFNGDGFPDFGITEPKANNQQDIIVEAGRFYVVLSNSTFIEYQATSYLDETLPNLVKFIGADAQARYSRYSAGIGDLNGDGYSDIILSGNNAGPPLIVYGFPTCYPGSQFSISVNGTIGSCDPCSSPTSSGFFNVNGSSSPLGNCVFNEFSCNPGEVLYKPPGATYSSCLSCPLAGLPEGEYSTNPDLDTSLESFAVSYPEIGSLLETGTLSECHAFPDPLQCGPGKYLAIDSTQTVTIVDDGSFEFTGGGEPPNISLSTWYCKSCPFPGQNPSISSSAFQCQCSQGYSLSSDSIEGIKKCTLSVESVPSIGNYIWFSLTIVSMSLLFGFRYRRVTAINSFGYDDDTTDDTTDDMKISAPNKVIFMNHLENIISQLKSFENDPGSLSLDQIFSKLILPNTESFFHIAWSSLTLLYTQDQNQNQNQNQDDTPSSTLVPIQEYSLVSSWFASSPMFAWNKRYYSPSDRVIILQHFTDFIQFLGILFIPIVSTGIFSNFTVTIFRAFLFEFSISSWTIIYWLVEFCIVLWTFLYFGRMYNLRTFLENTITPESSNLKLKFVSIVTNFLRLEILLLSLFSTVFAIPLFLTPLNAFKCATFEFPGIEKNNEYIVASVDATSPTGYENGVPCWSLTHWLMMATSLISLLIFVPTSLSYLPNVQYRGKSSFIYKNSFLSNFLMLKLIIATLSLFISSKTSASQISVTDNTVTIVIVTLLLILLTFYHFKTNPCLTFQLLNTLRNTTFLTLCFYGIIQILMLIFLSNPDIIFILGIIQYSVLALFVIVSGYLLFKIRKSKVGDGVGGTF